LGLSQQSDVRGRDRQNLDFLDRKRSLYPQINLDAMPEASDIVLALIIGPSTHFENGINMEPTILSLPNDD
jgi:hypothetical protein